MCARARLHSSHLRRRTTNLESLKQLSFLISTAGGVLLLRCRRTEMSPETAGKFFGGGTECNDTGSCI